MERITRTLKVLEIETPNGEVRYISPKDVMCIDGCKVIGRKKLVAEMPISVFIENAYTKEVE